MKPYSYYNGTIIPTEKVMIPMTDIGFVRGFGIFDYTKVYDGVPFLLKEHIARLKRSAKIMGLSVPMSEKQIESTITKLLGRYKAPLAAIRIILTGGPSAGLSYAKGKETFIIAIEPLQNLPEHLYKKGATLMTYEHERLFPEVKTLNYITAVKLQKERNKKKAIEILYTSEGKILEATTSNFFWIKGTNIITSKENILIGVTRNHILNLAQDAGFTIVEQDSMLEDLADAEEAFITASNKEVLPIVAIDGMKIGDGKVGEGVKLLMLAYKKSVEDYVRKYRTN